MTDGNSGQMPVSVQAGDGRLQYQRNVSRFEVFPAIARESPGAVFLFHHGQYLFPGGRQLGCQDLPYIAAAKKNDPLPNVLSVFMDQALHTAGGIDAGGVPPSSRDWGVLS